MLLPPVTLQERKASFSQPTEHCKGTGAGPKVHPEATTSKHDSSSANRPIVQLISVMP